MTNITELEKAVLINIAENEMTELNGGFPSSADEVSIWTESIEEGGPVAGPSGKALSGVLSSLNKKKLIDHYDDPQYPKDSTTWLTEEGFQVYKSFNRMEK